MTSSAKPWTQTVFIHLDGQAHAVPAGILSLYEEGPRTVTAEFTYGNLYLTRPGAISVDPVSMPLAEAKKKKETRFTPVNGLALFGAIRDAAPDAWGRRVIENKLKAAPNGLPESIYLLHAGPNRAGALDFRSSPQSAQAEGMLPGTKDLSYLLDAAAKIEEGEPVPTNLQLLFDVGATFGGARPKAAVLHDNRQWVAKFPARGDGFNVPLVERATLELARACGLRVPQTRHIPLPDGRDVMLIERFDRPMLQNGMFGKRHVISALTLLKMHESDTAKAQYTDMAIAIDDVGAKGFVQQDRIELFKRMVFNILISNDDDHLRNHAFVWDTPNQGWRLSQLYDVVPKPQQGFERFLVLGVGTQGRLATLDNALSAAPGFGILSKEASTFIDQLASVVREWRVLFEQMGVPKSECDKIASAFRNPKDLGLKEAKKQK